MATRRIFLRQFTSLTLGAAIGAVSAPAGAGPYSSSVRTGAPGCDVFFGALGTDFRMRLDSVGWVRLTLDRVQPLTGVGDGVDRAGGGWNEAFSLLFSSDHPTPLSQATYALEHESLGLFDLFMVPMSGNQGLPCYEAIINRLVPREMAAVTTRKD